MVIRYYNSIHKTHIVRVSDINNVELNNWLNSNIGVGGWVEYIGFIEFPWRAFSFKEEFHETLFTLRFS